MEYIYVKDGIVTEHCCGQYLPTNAILVPNGFKGYVGCKFAALKSDLSGLRPLSEQVQMGIEEIPDGYKIDKDDKRFVRMSDDELKEKYPSLCYAIPGTCNSQMIHKTFDNKGNFGLFPPAGYIHMDKEQPSSDYRAREDGTWEFDEEVAAKNIRRERDSRLAETDYLMIDYPLSDESKTDISVYRQALRDVPNQQSFPNEVVWPEMPVIKKK